MRVVDKRQNPITIDFENLEYGDVFQDEDNDICIKIDNDYSAANAVVLSTGQAFHCNMDTPVTPLNSEVIITNK
jgi:hypothetical protein